FVLSPFAFVFLLSGKEQYHIILETLDTEEATYIWHTDKDRTILKNSIEIIDSHLQIIREKGREKFMEENMPTNFSRIIHNYSDDSDKGFMLWKTYLEETLR